MMTPAAVTATPCGTLKDDDVPKPLADAMAPLPASVVTTPLGLMRRMRRFPPSATRTFPEASMATERGLLNAAVPLLASVQAADPDPAKVVTTPARVTLRIKLLYMSGT